MSSSSRVISSPAVCVSMLVVLGELGRVRVRSRQIGKAMRRWPRRLVDAVANDRTVACVHEQREQRVHDVVVRGPPAAGLVCTPFAMSALDLEEGTLFDVRLRDV